MRPWPICGVIEGMIRVLAFPYFLMRFPKDGNTNGTTPRFDNFFYKCPSSFSMSRALATTAQTAAFLGSRSVTHTVTRSVTHTVTRSVTHTVARRRARTCKYHLQAKLVNHWGGE